ncbi:hypothetical protein SS50377_23048 [Spironucleus salmonicida]|uniref:Uncharacterized protein n=1 Tax=Spironucleus salmonicida TaxID=348837 RepID=V6LSN5_9EUKA|nr:hypothetical protein SS50377_23048 [Spironucleus salmonicida]|eukprot:EST47625.1 Hypothetical protein SS50377_12319 [Spironucleus salmonicida]
MNEIQRQTKSRPQFMISTSTALRYKESGVKVLNSTKRTAMMQRGSPLPEFKDFDYRAPSPQRKDFIPKVTQSSLADFMDTTAYRDKKKLAQQAENEYIKIQQHKKQPKVYYGPTATGAEYKVKKEEQYEQFLPVVMSQGSYLTKTVQLRNTCQVTREHPGRLTEIGDEVIWSCCGGYEQVCGCKETVYRLGQTHMESPFTIVK